MNLNIFNDEKYYDKVDDLLYIYESNPIFPFEDMGINPDHLVSDIYDAVMDSLEHYMLKSYF